MISYGFGEIFQKSYPVERMWTAASGYALSWKICFFIFVSVKQWFKERLYFRFLLISKTSLVL